MATTRLSDAIIPDVYLSYTAVDSPEKSVLVTSGVVTSNAVVQQAANSPGIAVTVPFWHDLDAAVEPNYSTDNPDDVAVPQKIGSGEMSTRKANLNQGWSTADLVAELAGSDPMRRIRNRTGVYWKRQFQRRIIALMAGLLANNIASHGGDMINNIAIEDGANAGVGNVFSRAGFTTALFTMGDMADELTAMAVHSVIYKRMIDNDDIAFIKPSDGSPDVPTFLGKRVLVDDTMPFMPGSASGFKYISYLFGRGALGFAEGDPEVPVEVYRRPDEGNGGGIETLWERKTWIMHPMGFDFTSHTITGQSPTLNDMRRSDNWNRVIDRKQIPIAFLVTNG